MATSPERKGSGLEPSSAGTVALSLKAALALVDVRVLDHVITSDDDALSMAGKGAPCRREALKGEAPAFFRCKPAANRRSTGS